MPDIPFFSGSQGQRILFLTPEFLIPSAASNTAAAGSSAGIWLLLPQSPFILVARRSLRLSSLRTSYHRVHWHNEGIWNTLERIEAWDYPRRYGQIETACGPVLGVGFIRNKIPIPRALYKILKRPDGQCLAFIIAQDGREIMAEELPAQLTSVRDIERKTGLRFEFIDERRKDSAAS